MPVWLWGPALLQAAMSGFDELWYHRRRGLPRWERVGHPVDTLAAALCYGWLAVARPAQPHALAVFCVLVAVSCALVTKDERVHAGRCVAGEHALHAWMFVLHPIVFTAFGIWWWLGGARWPIEIEFGLSLAFMTYQLAYWSILWKPTILSEPQTTPSTAS